ncbi:MAG TPA: transposase [Candidatus Obscuribacterales bacterium]
MEQQSQWVGIDVSKASLDVYLRPSGKQFQVSNQTSGIVELVGQLQTFNIRQVILEASGRLELEAAQILQEQGYAISIINPWQRRDFAKASGKLAKNRPH